MAKLDLNYDELLAEIIKKLQSEGTIVLATSAENKVTARLIWYVNDGLTILFATEGHSQKVEQIKINPNIALAIGNLKIEATAELFGHPSKHPFICEKYPSKYPDVGKNWPGTPIETPNSMLVIAKPSKISLYKYKDKSCEDVLEVEKKMAYQLDL
jgi:general stress protein 26